MDFELSEEHEAVRDLARRVLTEHGDPDRLAALERDGWFDRDAWAALAQAGLLGVSLPGQHGGGLGFLAVHLLLEEAGATVAHVPMWETLVAATALAGHPREDELLRGLAAGETLLTLALQDEGADPGEPVTRAASAAAGGAWRLTGEKVLVPAAGFAHHLVVSAVTDAGAAGLFLVDRDDVSLTPHHLSSDVPHDRVLLADTPATALGEPGDGRLTAVVERAVAGLASLQSGMASAAVRLAADYTSEREQFGRPIATFQAVSQRVANAFIDAQCASLTALEAAWRLDQGLPAADEVAIAKYWAAEAGHRVLHACQHVHGGVGVDRDYPLHRYLLRTKQVEFALGTATDHLHALGASLAAQPV